MQTSLPRRVRKKDNWFFRSEPAAPDGVKEKKLSDVDQRHANAVAWLHTWTPKRFPTIKAEFAYNDDIQAQQNKRVDELQETILRFCDLVDVGLMREQERAELHDAKATIMERVSDIVKAGEEPYIRLLCDYGFVLDAVAIASTKIETKQQENEQAEPRRAAEDDRAANEVADDSKVEEYQGNNENDHSSEDSAHDEDEGDESDDELANVYRALQETRPRLRKRRKSSFVDTDEEAEAAVKAWRRRSSIERSRQGHKRRSTGNSLGSSDSFSRATGAFRVENPLRVTRTSSSSLTPGSRPGSDYLFQHVQSREAREDMWAALFGPGSPMPNLSQPNESSKARREAIEQAIEDANRRAQEEAEAEAEEEQEEERRRSGFRGELGRSRWGSDSRHYSGGHVTSPTKKDRLELYLAPATTLDLESSPCFDKLGPPPVNPSATHGGLPEELPLPDGSEDTDSTSSDSEAYRLSPILEQVDSEAELAPAQTLEEKIQAFRKLMPSPSQRHLHRSRSNSLPAILNVEQVSTSVSEAASVPQAAASVNPVTAAPLRSRLLAFMQEQQAAWVSVLWFLLASVFRSMARPFSVVLAWDLDWCQPPPLDLTALSTVLTHMSILVFGFQVQIWLALRTERKIWLGANRDTRAYLLDIIREDPSWWWLPGVNPKLMLRWSELWGSLWLAVLCCWVWLSILHAGRTRIK
ncbi:uncharacterized protein F5Z01DRAFT_670456 [Emericellopsis atlantica]|uniref:Uncharacterized protein n=1 Tax=Emericellopsis atlantica TaxID=2614577 RepID=A0A9P8CU28_9HYPO|nr:uncharacterized protein F5Z01DRAFT_670456 [Emericellopsis atlantica]KAG9258750.1 hypothetical protein F5Z01DRAFT_670456 [Emericellopsis atlantica]